MVLPVFRFAADHPTIIAIAIVVYAVSVSRMIEYLKICEERSGGPAPDLMFGFSPDKLREIYSAWGDEGCQAYIQASYLDLFPYMESYSVVLGALLVLGARRQGWKDTIAMAALATMLCDVVETSILQHGCRHEPEYLSDTAIKESSFFNKLKWILFAVSSCTIAAAFILPKPKPVPAKE